MQATVQYVMARQRGLYSRSWPPKKVPPRRLAFSSLFLCIRPLTVFAPIPFPFLASFGPFDVFYRLLVALLPFLNLLLSEAGLAQSIRTLLPETGSIPQSLKGLIPVIETALVIHLYVGLRVVARRESIIHS